MQPAHIARVNADGTYDIVFDDGTATIMKALGIDELYVLTTTDPSAPLATRGRGTPGGSSNDSKEGEGQRSDMDVREVMSVEEELARITQEAEAERVKLSLAMEMEAARQKKVMRRKLQRRRKRRNSIQNIKMNQGHGGEEGGGGADDGNVSKGGGVGVGVRKGDGSKLGPLPPIRGGGGGGGEGGGEGGWMVPPMLLKSPKANDRNSPKSFTFESNDARGEGGEGGEGGERGEGKSGGGGNASTESGEAKSNVGGGRGAWAAPDATAKLLQEAQELRSRLAVSMQQSNSASTHEGKGGESSGQSGQGGGSAAALEAAALRSMGSMGNATSLRYLSRFVTVNPAAAAASASNSLGAGGYGAHRGGVILVAPKKKRHSNDFTEEDG
jgi:hypothetical protein